MIAIFDIDGTLTESQAIDNACFVRAFADAFGIHDVDTDWSRYPHTTERALTAEILRRNGFAGDESDLVRHRDTFVALLRKSGGEIGEIAGARRFVDELVRLGWSVVFATGAWSHSARIKLRAAGFRDQFPLACCDAAATREEIVARAIAIADGTPPVILFGDAVWDIRTAAAMRLPIVGVGRNALGATVQIDDYSDMAAVLQAMETALSS